MEHLLFRETKADLQRTHNGGTTDLRPKKVGGTGDSGQSLFVPLEEVQFCSVKADGLQPHGLQVKIKEFKGSILQV